MGESERAGNKGVPGTPRDGAPVEITGLLKSALRWLAELVQRGVIATDHVDAVRDGKPVRVTFAEWGDLISAAFERCYYVPASASDDAQYEVDAAALGRRGIYKDVYGTPEGRRRADFQLRANFPIAMAVAPELFDPHRALAALCVYEDVLVGPLGVATLDPADPDYRPYYDNANDTDDFAVGKGRNYHQVRPLRRKPRRVSVRLTALHFLRALSGSGRSATSCARCCGSTAWSAPAARCVRWAYSGRTPG